MSDAEGASVFVSHTTRDRRDFALAHSLADGLKKVGAQVWIAPESIPVGERWKEPLVAAILKKSTHFLVIVSAASMGASWVLREIDLARQRSESDGDYRVLPLMVGAVDESQALEFVGMFQAVPYSDDPHEQLQRVARAMGLDYTPPAQPADHLRAKEYLDRGIEREKQTVSSIRTLRIAAPIAGLGVAVALWLGAPTLAESWAVALGAAPIVTGLAGWGATWRRFAAARGQLRWLEEMRDGLDVCMGAESDRCRRVWDAFWTYVEQRSLRAASVHA